MAELWLTHFDDQDYAMLLSELKAWHNSSLAQAKPGSLHMLSLALQNRDFCLQIINKEMDAHHG